MLSCKGYDIEDLTFEGKYLGKRVWFICPCGCEEERTYSTTNNMLWEEDIEKQYIKYNHRDTYFKIILPQNKA